MSIFHRATVTPTKAELIAGWIPTRSWGPAPTHRVEVIGSYRFDDPDDRADPGGRPPPGQRNTRNLALLCRFHHRLKTHGGWTYQRANDTVLRWTSPIGRCYTVDEHGTLPRA